MVNCIVKNHIKEICEQKGKTLRWLASEAAVSEALIYKVASQDVNFRLDTAARICCALDCDFSDLFEIVKI